MKIEPFDEGLDQRNIVAYDPAYAEVFAAAREYVQARLPAVELVHIGSTAIVGLRGKPMIDTAAITTRENLREEQAQFEASASTAARSGSTATRSRTSAARCCTQDGASISTSTSATAAIRSTGIRWPSSASSNAAPTCA